MSFTLIQDFLADFTCLVVRKRSKGVHVSGEVIATFVLFTCRAFLSFFSSETEGDPSDGCSLRYH